MPCFGRYRRYCKRNIRLLGQASAALDGGNGDIEIPCSYDSIDRQSYEVAGLSSNMRNGDFSLTF